MAWRPAYAVIEREFLRMLRQRMRLLAAMVRPLLWLFVIGAGFAAVVGEARAVDYRGFLVPGVVAMTILFGGVLAALATVHDKEAGVMRTMLVAPLSRTFLVLAKVAAAAAVAMVQAALLLAILFLLGILHGDTNWGLLALALAAVSVTCSAIGMLAASFARSVENFAGIMNFMIFPLIFVSGTLYPVGDLPGMLGAAAAANPYTYCVDLLKHALLPGAPMGAEFGLGLDLALVIATAVVAVAVASLRLSQEAAHEPILRAISRRPE